MENLAYKKYTYQDLLEIDDGKRYEIIDGVLYEMSLPSVNHQDIVGKLYVQLHNYLKGKNARFLFQHWMCVYQELKNLKRNIILLNQNNFSIYIK